MNETNKLIHQMLNPIFGCRFYIKFVRNCNGSSNIWKEYKIYGYPSEYKDIIDSYLGKDNHITIFEFGDKNQLHFTSEISEIFIKYDDKIELFKYDGSNKKYISTQASPGNVALGYYEGIKFKSKSGKEFKSSTHYFAGMVDVYIIKE